MCSSKSAWWRGLLAFALISVVGCSQLSKKDALVEEDGLASKQEQEAVILESDFKNALALHRNGDIDAAEGAYLNIIARDAVLVSPRFNLAQIYVERAETAQASVMLDEVLTLNASHKQALNLRGVLAREEGKFEDAERLYRQALAVDQNFGPAIRNLAILLDLYLGRLSEALPMYEQYQALQEKPDAQVKDWIFDLKRRLGDGR